MGEEEDQQKMKRMGVVEEEEDEGEEGEEDGGRNAVRRDGPVTLRLLDASLWNAFRREGTEMIITKAGRRMFPFVMVKLEGLTPTLLYSVHLSLVPCDHRQYKFCQRRWIKVSDVTPGPTPTPEQAYAHPASPNRGAYWCQEMISFAKLKITNNKHSQGDIVLQSMRKYMAQIIVREDQGDAEYVFPFPETTFVAVTQYQNEAVTRMKIAHNPFANGFKYAHVTGTEDGTKLFTRSELSRCHDSRQKHTSSSSSKAKAARVKATLQRPTLTPLILNPHQPDDLKLVSSALSLPGAPQPLYFSPPMTLEAETGPCLSLPQILQGGFQIPSSVAMSSPYLFRSEEGESPDEEDVSLEKDLSVESSFASSFKAEAYQEPETCPKSGGFRSRVEDAQGRDSTEEETPDEDVIESFSPTTFTTTPTSTALPTTVTDSEESGATFLQPTISDNDEIHDRQTSFLTPLSKSSLSRVFSVSSTNTGVPTSLSKKGGLFKQPLPRRGAILSARKAGKRGLAGEETGEESSSSSSSSSGAVAALESDTDRCSRATLHKVSHKHRKWAVKHDRGVQLKLHDGHIWHSFAACGSGMVLSAEGRNMFPVISISLRGLDPGRLYSVWLHVTAADAADVTCPSHPVRHPTLWPGPLLPGASRRPLPAAPSNVRPYMHPCSPMRGLAWMKVKVDFSEVKLTTLTSDSAAPVVAKDSLPLQGGRQYLTQIVVREEEEITPSGAGLWGNTYFFPLQEVTFVTKLETDVCQSTGSVTTSDNALSQPGKRRRDSTDSCFEETASEVPDGSTTASITPAKVARMDMSAGGGHWMKSPIVLPRHTDLTPLLSRPPDLASLLPRQQDLCNRINPLYCFPPFSTLPPSAHVGFLANRMPLPVTSPLQSIASFPYQPPPQLLPQLRSPMHSAFAAMPVPSATPFPYCYYPYALQHPQVALSSPSVASAVSEASQGLDLSLKSSDEIV